MKLFTFTDLVAFINEQPDNRKINMKQYISWMGDKCGCILMQFARTHFPNEKNILCNVDSITDSHMVIASFNSNLRDVNGENSITGQFISKMILLQYSYKRKLLNYGIVKAELKKFMAEKEM